ncbi:bifunctional serine/threonine-protein kinase/formylglycine-generating enzyme family protein [Rubellicoccus peritrichatus]|uniref:Bifunctional serine/threonine-protein kinase/formylglycine-generating enzyme family protein n=1 Tax=Rubellicoccus peritrichatus TaxID=3080537 RepID=A0AAQ3LAD5_9BACT|nr:bifunctional serine/threonine-protein kinase/formylglycine-generating enzyme family protein [Puniceicoccus sp. CR14]WOO40582.1 bifunctional serine/threonine-protein kinase/formylglycine-generating enzyme family protein [Puniceicoccus sp. CR14]
MSNTPLSNGLLVFERFRLKMLLGRGGMGVVWLARDEELEIDIALKFLSEDLFRDSSALRDLKKETRRGMALSHPNIVRVYGFYSSNNGAAVAMEFVEGNTLCSLRDTRLNDAFEVDELKPWIAELCSALHYAHTEAEIVHRDLKPGNLMVDHRNRLKVADFGIASSLSDAQTRITGTVSPRGTLSYMSPQQLLGQRPCISHDIYSLGATLYDLLTGKPPFYSGDISLQIRETQPPSIAERREELEFIGYPLTKEWEETIAACLSKDASKRPRTAMEVLQRLNLQDYEPARSGSAFPFDKAATSKDTPAISEPTVYEPIPFTPRAEPTQAQPETKTGNTDVTTEPALTTTHSVVTASRWSGLRTALMVFVSVLAGGAIVFYATKELITVESRSNKMGFGINEPDYNPPPVQQFPNSLTTSEGEWNHQPPNSNNRPIPPPGMATGTTGQMAPPQNARPGMGQAGPRTQGPLLQTSSEPREVLDEPVAGKDFDLPGSDLIFSWVPSKEFLVGSPPFDTRANDDEKPITRVIFTRGYWISRYETTQGEFQKAMGSNPSHHKGEPNLPVDSVTWYEAMKFCDRLNKKYADIIPAGYTFSLPSQSQFEYASSAGINRIHGGANVREKAWGNFKGVSETQPVGQLEPNNWEVYDTFGNVAEWCLDWYADTLPGNEVVDWVGPAKGEYKVVKGGTIKHDPWGLRVFSRNAIAPNERDALIGFRVALVPINSHHIARN